MRQFSVACQGLENAYREVMHKVAVKSFQSASANRQNSRESNMDPMIRRLRWSRALSGLALLAGITFLAMQHGTPAAARPATNHTVALNGTANGRYLLAPSNPDVGAVYVIAASGKIAPMGQTAVNGSIRTPGFVAQGTATGHLTLSSAQGKVMVDLQGPVQAGFSPPPAQFQYTVVGGTGAFLHATGSGTLDLQLKPQQGGGKATLTFTPAAVG
jgi:hypothetical protein